MRKIVLILIIIPLLAIGQDIEQQRAAQTKRLEELRREIEQVEAKLKQAQSDRKQVEEILADLEQKLALRASLLRELNSDRELTEKELTRSQVNLKNLRGEIVGLDLNIESLLSDIDALKQTASKRAVYAYKKSRWDELRLILSAESFNQALVRKKYFTLAAKRDKDRLDELAMKKSLLAGNRTQKLSVEATLVSEEAEMKDRLEHKRKLIGETRTEEKKLNSEKKQKENLLADLIKDNKALQRDLEAKKAAAKEVEKLIASLVEKPKVMEEVELAFPNLDFAKLKGIMEWPALGEIIAHFGRQLNPKFNTWTENTGVDISTKTGTNIRAVASGKVTVVTWLRGYGTTMIISHPGGYYTVYSHLDETLADVGEMVEGGSVIAKAGDSGSTGGAKLHFEIWEKKNKQDPEKWLKKRN
jgi:murein hydrolase activator